MWRVKIRNRSRDPADKLIILKEKKTDIIGKFGCKGYDTFGPFKLVGGIAKGHPDAKDLEVAVSFVAGLQ